MQANGHHAAPVLAGPDGLPMQWAESMRAVVVSEAGKRRLCPKACAQLIFLLKRHPVLGGMDGKHAKAVVADLEAQAGHIKSYFARWRSLEGMVHAVALEIVVQGPLTERVAMLASEHNLEYLDAMPRIPAQRALAAAVDGIRLFEAASEEERADLPGTLAWRLFSPKTRDGATNTTFACLQSFATGTLNSRSGQAFPYRCWPELAQVLVAGGAKNCPTTSAQVEGFFNALTRQQGASKTHCSQPQISYEARTVKNATIGTVTERVMGEEWADARSIQGMFDSKGFWVCDAGLAADRKLSQKLKEEREVELAQEAIDGEEAEDDGMEGDGSVGTYDAEKILRHSKDRTTGEYVYVVKWVGYDTSNTARYKLNLLCDTWCSPIRVSAFHPPKPP